MRRLTVAGLVALLAASWARGPSGELEVAAKEPLSAASVLTTGQRAPGSDGGVWLLTVTATPASNGRTVWCRLAGDCTLTPEAAASPTVSDEASQSVLAAVSATAASVGVGDDARDALIDHVRDAGVRGGSGGLAWSLSLLDLATNGQLTGGLSVAATGALNPDGSVRPVGFADLKTQAALDAGADLVLVPEGETTTNSPRAHGRVVTVTSLDEALRAICGQSKDAAACTLDPRDFTPLEPSSHDS